MLKELSEWGVRCFASFDNGQEIPPPLFKLVRGWLKDKTHHWTHLGGVVDPGCIKTSPRKRRRFEKALVVAAELSARIGASLLFHDPLTRQRNSILTLQVWVHGLQQGRSDEEMFAAWNMALYNAPQFSSLNGVDRVLVWKTLECWSQQCLDHPSIANTAKWDPSNLLTTVRLGLSDVWYMTTIHPVATKGSLEWITAIQSVEEILKRHVKAASKRLRYQQVEHIEISVPHIFDGSASSVSEWVSKFILTHEWTTEHDDAQWCDQMAVPLRELSSKIQYKFAPSLTETMFTQMLIELPDIFVGTSIQQAAQVTRLPLNWVSIRSHRALKKAIQDCGYVTGIPTQSQLDAFKLQVPVQVRLMTTRGGTWPERREQILFAADM